MAAAQQVLVVGETLVDIVHTPDGLVEEHVGGSPANVAMGLARLSHDTVLATSLGEDPHGTRCRGHVTDRGVRIENLDAGDHPTSTAIATLDDSGAAEYEFDLHWDLRPIHRLDRFAHVHTGSIAATLTPGAAVVAQTLRDARAHATISYDPNARPTIMGDVDGVRPRIEELIALSDVVKASEDDVEWLYAGRTLPDVMAAWGRLGPGLVVITRGGDGVTYRVTATGETAESPARVDRVTDTVGAGDSFMAGLVSGLLDAGLLGEAAARARLAGATLGDVTGAVDRAMSTSAITVVHAGAYAPTRDELPADAATTPQGRGPQ
ncbi:carbohydrate kinase family protein [Knoellia aerolata]|uniref:Fructokinase n=1 Tax=Knoellia aerolata DSM 18566 TaxID=1385519 RepID=A0A0A0K079_9MICO|nr:carbohydrate kinase [Knoellia aerolata]KGN43085.1 fructokinase [Knoellia aerolata DSM 18566]